MIRRCAPLAILLILVAGPVLAQTRGKVDLDELRQRDRELEAIRSQQKQALEDEYKLRQEIDSFGNDRAKLNSQLISTAARVREIETRIADTQERLAPLNERERGLRQSLTSQNAVLAEVLAALQRIGRRPPPALLVRPEDALQALRTAMMLGAVLPEMQEQAAILINDLGELAMVRKAVDEEHAGLRRDLTAINQDRERVRLLLEARRKAQTESEQALAAARQKVADLGRQASTLTDLIVKLEAPLDRATRDSRTAARSLTERETLESRPELAVLNDPARLAPAVAFASAKASLPMPVNGVRLRQFGTSDGLGGTEKGISIATRAEAQVTAPCDGWVVYSGPFRNYGQLLILNAGGGYHVVLAGMARISVDLGHFVLTGEPVGVMGGGQAAAIAPGSKQPVLYIEFRKDGVPVDPSPWWATKESEKVRG